MKNLLLIPAFSVLISASTHAAQWEYRFSGPPPAVEIAPLQWGKSWAYAVEIDDGPTSTLEVSQPLLAKYQWNDAPPGVAGGTDRPFVGTAAVSFGSVDTTNSTYLNIKQLAELRAAGWDIVNHSYWHTGNHWDASQFLQPADFRRELFWSQIFYAQSGGANDEASGVATHFVYPNGDYHYGPYLKEFGLRSASRVGGTSPRNVFNAKWNPLDLDRNYLDTEPWLTQNDALAGLPQSPRNGDFIIDFTHGMSGDADSANGKLWKERLDFLARYGARGDNSMWVAPSNRVVNYRLAASVASVSATPGVITVTLPDDAPASALTLKLSGLNAQTQLPALAGTTIFRQGDSAWMTTPILGEVAGAPLEPRLRKIYSGPVVDLNWDEPVEIAGVRLLQSAPLAENTVFVMEAQTPAGQTVSLVPDGAKIEKLWGRWLLFPTLPDRDAIAARGLKVSPDPNLRQMEVWALAP